MDGTKVGVCYFAISRKSIAQNPFFTSALLPDVHFGNGKKTRLLENFPIHLGVLQVPPRPTDFLPHLAGLPLGSKGFDLTIHFYDRFALPSSQTPRQYSKVRHHLLSCFSALDPMPRSIGLKIFVESFPRHIRVFLSAQPVSNFWKKVHLWDSAANYSEPNTVAQGVRVVAVPEGRVAFARTVIPAAST